MTGRDAPSPRAALTERHLYGLVAHRQTHTPRTLRPRCFGVFFVRGVHTIVGGSMQNIFGKKGEEGGMPARMPAR